jgi:CubicO group peptidase (beta-lactamase class C family)
MAVTFSEYHGVSAQEHQNQITSLTSQGYRMISLCVSGDPASPRYTAVWVQRTGPAFQEVHGVDAAGYQNFFNQATAQGYNPTLVSATGQTTNAVFTAVFEQGANSSGWFARHNMVSGSDTNPNSFQYYCKSAQANGYLLLSVTIYGDSTNRLYAAIWAKTPLPVQWASHPADSETDYQAWYDAVTQLPFRPSYVALSSDQQYASVFRDDSIGTVINRHGLSAADYASLLASLQPQGYYPVNLQAGGIGGDTRYSVIFAKQDLPSARSWMMTGTLVPSLIQFDAAMKNHMNREGIRAGSLAIAKNGVLKFARAYTWAEPGYATTQPTNLFRVASLSKMFTCAAIKKLYDAGTLQPTTTVYPLLGTTPPPGQTPDARSDTITVQQLVDHTGGWIRNQTSDPTVSPNPFDPVFVMRGIALRLGLTTALGKADLASYMYGQPLQFDPGSPPAGVDTYSNYGYVLLGMVIEKVTGMTYWDYVRQNILAPLGISDVAPAQTLRSQRAPSEVQYDDPGLGLSAVDPTSTLLTPYAYGGEGWKIETMDSAGGLMATTKALVTMAHTWAVWGLGPRVPSTRTGGMAGTNSLVCSRSDGIDYAFVFNTNHNAPLVVDDIAHTLDQLFATVPIN